MGKTADLTVVQKTTIDTLHKEGKTQKVIAKEAAVHRALCPSTYIHYICLYGYIHFIYLFNPNTKYRDMYRIPQIRTKILRY